MATKLTPEISTTITTRIKDGMPIKVAAARSGIGVRTAMDWLARGRLKDAEEPYASFATAVEEARAIFMEEQVARVRNGTTSSGEDDWRAGAWLLERQFPDEFKEKKTVEHTGDEGGAIKLDLGRVSTEDLRAMKRVHALAKKGIGDDEKD